MLRPGITYTNVSIGKLAALIERVANAPQGIGDLSNEDRQLASFAIDAYLMIEKNGKYSVTKAGEDFLKANQKDRRAIFKSIVIRPIILDATIPYN